jgi:hypothetical protein
MVKSIKKQRITKEFLLLLIALAFNSCATVRENRLMGDVIGFSDDVQTSFDYQPGFFKNFMPQSNPYDLLNPSERNEMDKFIRSIPDGQNTVGYYALDMALDRIKYVRKKVMHKDPETKYYIVLLTDGLDNGSTVVAQNNHQGHYKDINSYISKLNKKKSKVMGRKQKQDYFQIYPILFTAGDLEKMRRSNNMDNVTFNNYVMNMMEGYRGSSKGVEKPAPIYGDNLDKLVKEFEEQFSIQGFEFLIPKGYLNKRIRMTIEDLTGNKASIEGTFAKQGYKFVFKDIAFSDGLISESVSTGGVIKSKNQSEKGSILSVFMIDNLKLNGKPFKINTDINTIEQEYQDFGYFVTNSEYQSQADSRKNAYVLMIIDGSKSFEENSALAKEKAIEMRRIVTK